MSHVVILTCLRFEYWSNMDLVTIWEDHRWTAIMLVVWQFDPYWTEDLQEPWFSSTEESSLRWLQFGIVGEEACSFKGTTRLELLKDEIEKNNLSYSENGPMDLWPSVSNYVLQVTSAENPKSIVAFLYFLDSGGGSYPEVISNAQVRWFQQKSQEINPGSR